MSKNTWAMLGIVLTVGAGCAQQQPAATPARSSTPAPTAAAAVPVQLDVLTLDEALKRIGSQPGKIVVVDSWATWCRPCVQEFPELVEIHRRFHGAGVVCMSASLDQPEDKDKALRFLKEQEAAFPNFLLADQQSWLDKWNIKGIPIVLVFGRDGKLLRKFDRDDPDNQFVYADVAKYVAELTSKDR